MLKQRWVPKPFNHLRIDFDLARQSHGKHQYLSRAAKSCTGNRRYLSRSLEEKQYFVTDYAFGVKKC